MAKRPGGNMSEWQRLCTGVPKWGSLLQRIGWNPRCLLTTTQPVSYHCRAVASKEVSLPFSLSAPSSYDCFCCSPAAGNGLSQLEKPLQQGLHKGREVFPYNNDPPWVSSYPAHSPQVPTVCSLSPPSLSPSSVPSHHPYSSGGVSHGHTI